jgi:hypothetical protein
MVLYKAITYKEGVINSVVITYAQLEWEISLFLGDNYEEDSLDDYLKQGKLVRDGLTMIWKKLSEFELENIRAYVADCEKENYQDLIQPIEDF